MRRITSKLLPTGTITKIKFTSTITLLDARSSVSEFNYDYTNSAGGTCTVSEHENFVFSGD